MAGTTHAHQAERAETEQAPVHPLAGLDSPAEATPEHMTDERIRRFVTRGHELTLASPRKWFVVRVPDTEKRELIKDAGSYARELGLGFRVKKSAQPDTLVYRVVKPAPKQSEK